MNTPKLENPFMTLGQLRKAGMLSRKGVILGVRKAWYHPFMEWLKIPIQPAIVRDASPNNILLVAKPRSAKTITLIATALTYESSLVAVDPKHGELYFCTSKRRLDMFGKNSTYRVDPYYECERVILSAIGLCGTDLTRCLQVFVQADQQMFEKRDVLGAGYADNPDYQMFIEQLRDETLATIQQGLNAKQLVRFRRLLDHFRLLFDVPKVRINVLDWILLDDPQIQLTVDSLIDAIVIQDKADNQRYFITKAGNILKAVILYVLAEMPPQYRNFAQVVHILNDYKRQGEAWQEWLDKMLASNALGGVVEERALEFSIPERELRSVLSTLDNQTNFLSNPYIRSFFSATDVDIRTIKTRPLSLYIVTPTAGLTQAQRLSRLLYVTVSLAVQSTTGKASQPVLYMADEFGNWGRMDKIYELLSLMPGLGLRSLLVVQSLSQLRMVYEGDGSKSIEQLCGTQWFKNISGLDDSAYVGKQIGQQWIRIFDKLKTTTDFISVMIDDPATHASRWQQLEVLRNEEIRQSQKIFVFCQGLPSAQIDVLNYLTDSRFQGLFMDNPQYADLGGDDTAQINENETAQMLNSGQKTELTDSNTDKF